MQCDLSLHYPKSMYQKIQNVGEQFRNRNTELEIFILYYSKILAIQNDTQRLQKIKYENIKSTNLITEGRGQRKSYVLRTVIPSHSCACGSTTSARPGYNYLILQPALDYRILANCFVCLLSLWNFVRKKRKKKKDVIWIPWIAYIQAVSHPFKYQFSVFGNGLKAWALVLIN